MKRALLAFLLALTALPMAAVCTKTTIADTVYYATGDVLSGTIKITNPMTITGADGCVVPANTVQTATVVAGALSIALIPNVGSVPTGTYYKAEYHVSGATFTENWIVPASGPQLLSGVRTSTPPVPSIQIPASQISGTVASAATATALAADPANCTAGQFPLGIDATGAAQGCTVPAIGSIRIANNFAGGDVGAMVNAADADLGATPGVIWLFGGGAISTQITISSNHTLRLFPGTYTSSVGTGNAGTPWSPTFAMSNNSNLRCEGWNTIIKETTDSQTMPTIVGPKPMFATLGNKTSTATSSNVAVEGCHFQGVGLTPNTFGGTVECGNTVGCKVLNNWFDTVQSIAVNAGGNSSTGNFADNVEIAGNLVTNSIEVEIAVVNAQNVNIHHNTHRDPGTTGAGMVDIEPNISTDRAKDIDVHDNIYDIRGAAGGSDFCVTVQIGTATAATKQGVKVHDNTCRGFDPATGGGHLINGIIASGKYVEVYNNYIVGAIQGGIITSNLDRGSIHDNTLVCSSGLGYNAFEINLGVNTTNTMVYSNYTINDSTCLGAIQSKKANIAEVGSGISNNYFWNNMTQGISLVGTGSKILMQTDPQGGLSIGSNGFGISTTVNGGFSLAALTAPTLQLIRTAAGGSFAAGTYFWKVTAVNAAGETAGSNEITASPTLNQMAEIQWTAAPGATAYKVYRSTTTGTETLCTTVSSGQVFYQDTGTACAGAGVPVTNTSLGLLAVESAAPNGVASSDLLWPDSTGHCWKFNANNGGNSGCLPGIGIPQTWTALQTFNAGISVSSCSGCGVVPLNAPAVSNQFVTAYNNSTGAFTQARPTCANLSDSTASCSTDATNAANISSGTLPVSRFCSWDTLGSFGPPNKYLLMPTIFPNSTDSPGVISPTAANRVYGIWVYFPCQITVTKVQFQITTAVASSHASVGIYNSSGTLLISSGAVDTSTTGFKQVTGLSSTAIGPGWIFSAQTSDSTTPQCSAWNSSTFFGQANTQAGAPDFMAYYSSSPSTGGALPGSISGANAGNATAGPCFVAWY